MKLSPVNFVTHEGIHTNVALELEQGQVHITRLSTPTRADTPWVIPAFVDLHIHGMGGFGPEQNDPAALLQLSGVLATQGVKAFCPTLYCASPIALARQLRALLPACGQETGARILGFHLEGPFISPQKPGVMKPQDIAPANLDDFKKIYDAAQGHIAIVTLAPEVPGIRPVIEFCIAHHIVVQAGHTNATYEQMQAAFDWGVHRVTHLGNAMSSLHHRAPGALGFALLHPEVSVEVIADGKHIHPGLLTQLKYLKPMAQITAITDALRPTGQISGPLIANGEEVILEDGFWKRKADGVTAGSALTMLGAFRQLRACGYTFTQAVACTSTNAARLAELFPHTKNIPKKFLLLTPDLQLKQVIG